MKTLISKLRLVRHIDAPVFRWREKKHTQGFQAFLKLNRKTGFFLTTGKERH